MASTAGQRELGISSGLGGRDGTRPGSAFPSGRAWVSEAAGEGQSGPRLAAVPQFFVLPFSCLLGAC